MQTKKIHDTSELVKKTHYGAKIIISGVATNSVLTAITNKIPDISSLTKKNRL